MDQIYIPLQLTQRKDLKHTAGSWSGADLEVRDDYQDMGGFVMGDEAEI